MRRNIRDLKYSRMFLIYRCLIHKNDEYILAACGLSLILLMRYNLVTFLVLVLVLCVSSYLICVRYGVGRTVLHISIYGLIMVALII